MSKPAHLRVIVEAHDIRKLTLPFGIPDKVEDLVSVIKEKFELQGNFSLLYQDKDFGDQFFTLTTSAEVKDKDTVKIVQVETSVILNLTPIDESDLCSTPIPLDQSVTPSWDQCSADESCSGSSVDTIMLSSSPACRADPWPARFTIPNFSHDVERIFQAANKSYHDGGALFQNPSVKSDILQALAEAIFHYTAYPTSLQILAVAEALIEKYPCLKEPGSFSALYGWQQSLKYKMHNYRTKLRSRELSCPELEVNSLKRKQLSDRAPAKNIKRPKKAEVNYLPPHPLGESQESLEKERLELLCEVKKKNNEKIIAEKMAKTFSSRRHEVVNLSPGIQDLMERWPALFSGAREEFRRISAVPLQQTFMRKLDGYTARLLNHMRAKGGVPGTKIRPILDRLNQSDSIERRRDAVIRSLIEYLGESGDDLFLDCQEADQDEYSQHTLKILVVHASTDEDPVDVSIIIEGNEVLSKCKGTAKACTMLMGLIYALNLVYPAKLKYTFEVFQKLFLELDGIKLSSKVQSLRTKLLA